MTLSDDVLAFLREADALRDRRRRVNPLSVDECVRLTTDFRDIPFCAELGIAPGGRFAP